MKPFFLLTGPSWKSGARPVYGTESWRRTYALAEWHPQLGPRLETVTCPGSPGHQGGGRRVGQLNVVLQTSRLAPFVWTWHGECIVADRVVSALRAERVTGFDLAPATIDAPSTLDTACVLGQERYWEFMVIGRGGDAHPSSGIRRIYECADCGLVRHSSYRKGLLVDPKNWDGSDIFTLDGYDRLYIVTEKVEAVIEQHAFANCFLYRVEEERWPDGVIRPEDVYGMSKGLNDPSVYRPG